MSSFNLKDRPTIARRLARVVATGMVMVVVAVGSLEGATFKIRLQEGTPPPGLTDGVQFLDQISITNNGQIYFGGDTTAASADEFFYKATLKPFSATLVAREGDAIPAQAGITFGAFDAVNGMNENGDFVFVSASQPGPLDVIGLNGLQYLRAGGTFNGEAVNSFHHPQIDGAGTPWYLADLGPNSATDISLFHGNTLLFREGGMVDGVPIATIVTSESTSGSNFRVNEAGDYMIVVDDGDAQGQDVHIIMNGDNILESGDLIPNAGIVYWFNQIGMTADGSHWFVQLSYPSESNPQFAGNEAFILDGTTLLIEQGQGLGDGLLVGTIQTGDVNKDGHWIVRVDLAGTGTGQDAIIIDGQIVARTGDPVDANFNWGSSIGFINDIRLNDCGAIALIADLVPSAGGSAVETLLTGSMFDDGDVNGDGAVDENDWDAFVDALINDAAPVCNVWRADINEDGFADGRDVGPFVEAILP